MQEEDNVKFVIIILNDETCVIIVHVAINIIMNSYDIVHDKYFNEHVNIIRSQHCKHESNI